jgi:hypothetical protein
MNTDEWNALKVGKSQVKVIEVINAAPHYHDYVGKVGTVERIAESAATYPIKVRFDDGLLLQFMPRELEIVK